MAVLTHDGPAAQHGTHVDHGPGPDDRADVDDGTHHDDGVVTDLHLLAEDGTRLDAGVDVLLVQQGNGRVAAVVLNDQLGDVILVRVQDGLDVLPVPEDEFRLPAGENGGVGEVDGGFLGQVDFDRGLLLGGADAFDDLLGVHGFRSSFGGRFFLVHGCTITPFFFCRKRFLLR